MIKDKKFLDKIVLELRKRMDGVQIQEAVKNNGIIGTGIYAEGKDSAFTPLIYLEGYYKEYLAGKKVSEIVEEIYEMLLRKQEKIGLREMDFKDFSAVRDKVVFRLVNYGANRGILNQVPFIEFHDLAIVFYFMIEHNEADQMTALIYREHIKRWNISEFDLLQLALINTPNLLPVRLQSISDTLKEMIKNEAGKGEMLIQFPEILENGEDTLYVLTNESKAYGASTLLYKGVLQQAAEKLGGDLFVLPSSVHEVLVTVYDEDISTCRLRELVYTVNREEVAAEERLSDNVYIYRKQIGCLELVQDKDEEEGTL